MEKKHTLRSGRGNSASAVSHRGGEAWPKGRCDVIVREQDSASPDWSCATGVWHLGYAPVMTARQLRQSWTRPPGPDEVSQCQIRTAATRRH